jgi:outer membrane protein assembly factor BamB
VFIGAVNGTVSAFAAKTGVLQWQYSLGPGHLLASPAADERRVYIGSMNGRVTALPVAAPQR